MADIRCDKQDIIVACSSGALTAALDIFWVGEFSLKDAHEWGSDKTEEFVKKVAKSQGFKGDDTKDAIKFLADEKKHKDGTRGFHIPADSNTADFGGGIQHHLRDFAHHPTPVGLFFSILTQFTEKSYGADSKGGFLVVDVRDKTFIGKNLQEKMLYGVTYWLFHMVSDMAGSGSLSEGTGIPGPIVSLMKELSVLPIFKKTDEKGRKEASVYITRLFNGTMLGERDENGKLIKEGLLKFDLRTELGIAHELFEQAVPVVLCECMVSVSYLIRRLIRVLKENTVSSIPDLIILKNQFFEKCSADELKRLRTLSSLSFSTVDLSAAAVVAFTKCEGDKKKFAIGFAKRVNYFGVGRLIIAGTGELGMCAEKFFYEYEPVVAKAKNKAIEKVDPNVIEVSDKSLSTVGVIAGIGTPIGFISAAIGVYKEISESAKEYKIAKEERIRIEAECKDAIELLNEYQEEMETVVSEYMIDRLTIFGGALDQMDVALIGDDTDYFIEANNKIQNKLGNDSQFTSMDEFDALMSSDSTLKL